MKLVAHARLQARAVSREVECEERITNNMTTKNDTTNNDEQALATADQFSTSMERPAHIGKTSKGTENISAEDTQIARLALSQALTPQVAEGREGWRAGVLFDSVTEEIIGKGPVHFAIVRVDKPIGIVFPPRGSSEPIEQIELTDPRMAFTKDAQGKSVNPIGTKIFNYLIVMLPIKASNPMSSILALSLKGSGIKVAKSLNAKIQRRDADLWAGVYSAAPVQAKSAKGEFWTWDIRNAGWVSPALEPSLKKLHDMLANKEVNVHQETNDVIDGELAGGEEGGSTDFPTGEGDM
jgi:hypothetical protein